LKLFIKEKNIKLALVFFICSLGIFSISYLIYSAYLKNQSQVISNSIKKEELVNKNVVVKKTSKAEDIDIKIAAVKSDTIESIVKVHEVLNNAVGDTNKPTEVTYKLSKEYADELNKVANTESWDYLKYDLQRSALNLEYASINKDKQSLIIAHRILHDLDAHVFNKNDINYNKSSFGDSQTYRLTHNLPSTVPTKLPPPGV